MTGFPLRGHGLALTGSLGLLFAGSLSCQAQEAPRSAPTGETVTYSRALEYVRQGGFDYQAFRSDLEGVTGIREDTQVAELPVESAGAKAYWIDAYNRNVISSVLEAKITSSVMDAGFPFFDRKQFSHFGDSLSLNDIEKRVLFPQFPDARLHFALVCAAQSCPPLYDQPFSEAEDLDRLLDSLTARSVNDFLFVQFDSATGEVLLSKLFDWYKADYEREAGSVIEFIAKYHEQGEALLERTWKIAFREYDWSLNQRPPRFR